MYKFYCITILTLLVLTGFGQPIKMVALADSLLKPGVKEAVVISYEFPDSIKVLQNKAVKNLKADPEWANKYVVRMVESGSKTLNFLEAYGLTRQEFDKMFTGFKNEKNVVFRETFDLKIRKISGIITFKGDKKLSAFNYLAIDTRKKQISYDNNYLTREVELTGQKTYAPILFGYEAFWGVTIPNKKQMAKWGAGFSIGKNIGDNRTTLCLLIQHSVSDIEYLCITIL